jgi:hypothetical protein
VLQSIFFHILSSSHPPGQPENFEKLITFDNKNPGDDWVNVGFLLNPDMLVASYMRKKLMYIAILFFIENFLTNEQLHF